MPSWSVILLPGGHKLFIKYAFMRGMLVNQVEPIWPFGDYVGVTGLADDTHDGQLPAAQLVNVSRFIVTLTRYQAGITKAGVTSSPV